MQKATNKPIIANKKDKSEFHKLRSALWRAYFALKKFSPKYFSQLSITPPPPYGGKARYISCDKQYITCKAHYVNYTLTTQECQPVKYDIPFLIVKSV